MGESDGRFNQPATRLEAERAGLREQRERVRPQPKDHTFCMGMEIGLRLAVRMAETHVGTHALCDELTTEADKIERLTGGANRMRDGELEWHSWMVELEMQSWEVS